MDKQSQKYTLIADLHTHTLASTHAYSTILENTAYAASVGISCIGMTDHAPMMVDSPHMWHFRGLRSLPNHINGVRVLRGVEADLLPDGTLDMLDHEIDFLELVLVSIHPPCYGEPQGVECETAAYISAIKNKYTDCISHSGLALYPYDYESVVIAAKNENKLIEINEHTFHARKKSVENCRNIAILCKKHNVRIAVNSDAHFAYEIGAAPLSLAMLDEIKFPRELIVNADEKNLNEFLTQRKKQKGVL